jgi:hypothetical protein
MSSKQRVFSHDNTTNYIEYLNNKNSVEALKTIKNSSNETVINRYTSYDQKINYSKSYYKYVKIDCSPCIHTKPPCDCPAPLIKKSDLIVSSLKKACINHYTNNIYKSNISYKKSETIDNPCEKCTDKPCTSCSDCNLKKHNLYPYGIYKEPKRVNLRLTDKLELHRWDPCPIKCPKPFDLLNIGYDNICDIKLNHNGKLIKPLFVH